MAKAWVLLLGIACGAGAAVYIWQRRRRELEGPGGPLPMEIAGTWLPPIEPAQVLRIGDTVTARRPGSGRPHHGVDLFAAPGTLVRAVGPGRVRAVVDGVAEAARVRAADPGRAGRLEAAGRFVEVVHEGGYLSRYLHLGEMRVKKGQQVQAGEVVGTVPAPGDPGSGIKRSDPHLHFEWRKGGEPLDPAAVFYAR